MDPLTTMTPTSEHCANSSAHLHSVYIQTRSAHLHGIHLEQLAFEHLPRLPRLHLRCARVRALRSALILRQARHGRVRALCDRTRGATALICTGPATQRRGPETASTVLMTPSPAASACACTSRSATTPSHPSTEIRIAWSLSSRVGGGGGAEASFSVLPTSLFASSCARERPDVAYARNDSTSKCPFSGGHADWRRTAARCCHLECFRGALCRVQGVEQRRAL